MGILYLNGNGVTQNAEEAVKLFHLAAEQNNAEALQNMGNLYLSGKCSLIKKNTAEARRYFELSEERSPNIDYNLASCLRNGNEDEQIEAVRLLRSAAEKGIAEAYNDLGLMYQAGRGGLAQSDLEALRCYELAAAKGCEAAIDNARTLNSLIEKKKTQYAVLVHIP